MKRSLLGVLAVPASGVVLALSCSFPDVAFVGDSAASSGSGAGLASSAGSGGGGGALPCKSPCDCDGDGYRSNAADCNHDGGDCDDHDPNVHPGQTAYFTDAGSVDYDYDCDGKREYELTGVLACPDGVLGSCDMTTVKWQGAVPDCGQSGTIGTCAAPPLQSCKENPTGSMKQGCR